MAPPEGSVTTRRAGAGGRLPVTRSWGRTELFPSLTSGPRVPAGWERAPPNEPTPAPTRGPEIEEGGSLEGPCSPQHLWKRLGVLRLERGSALEV